LELGVEFFVGRHLVEKAAVYEPDLAGVVQPRRTAEKFDAAGAVNGHIGRIDFDALGLIELELRVGDLRVVVRRQLIAYHTAVIMGTDVDEKSVTVE
jgi:hypothetical protein